MHPCNVSVMSYYIMHAHTPVMSTAIASLLGVKFGDSQMTSHAGGGDGVSVV